MTTTWDVIVCGAGTAGMPCAIFAARRGARVLVIEASERLGGTLYVSGGQMAAAGTRVQKERGIDDHPDKHYAEVMRISKNGAHAKLARTAVDGAADSLHWLLDNGFQLTPGHPAISFGHEPYSLPRTYWGVENGISILKAIQPQFEAEIAKGRVTLMLNTEVVGLLQAKAGGAVTGVVVRTKEGRREEIGGQNVVLMTGGYARNKQVFPLFSGGYPLFGGLANEHSQGTGLTLGLMAGSELWGTDSYMPTFAGINDPRDPSRQIIATLTTPQLRQPWEIFVGPDGKRFVREDDPSVDDREHALRLLPNLTFWAIYDQAIAKEAPPFFVNLNVQALDDSGSGQVQGASSQDIVEASFNRIDGWHKADSIEGVARMAGINPGGLAATVAQFNQAVAAAADPLGRKHMPKPIKQGPFYAVRHHGVAVVSFAGLAVSDRLQVLRRDGVPLPGLYAAGEILGKSLLSGKSFVGGMSVLPSITFARLLGAQYLQWQGARLAAAE
ncbi:MAG: FAD-dependent oxidoreductase [Alphaproteobacteria bacterium]|nr:FAD-dependent oxidoreductase [Alphaproteobacteria bacterium]